MKLSLYIQYHHFSFLFNMHTEVNTVVMMVQVLTPIIVALLPHIHF